MCPLPRGRGCGAESSVQSGPGPDHRTRPRSRPVPAVPARRTLRGALPDVDAAAPSPSVRERIRLAFAAWPEFLKLFNAYLRERCIRSVQWFRVFEWTEASDGLGHPHFHVWLFSPYIDVELIREWWRRALQSVGCAIEKHVIVDVAAVQDPTSAARELIKYMLKDICANGDKVPPAVFSQVYEALAGRRMRQGSDGFMGLAKRALPCCDCGATLPRRVRIERRPKPTQGEGS